MRDHGQHNETDGLESYLEKNAATVFGSVDELEKYVDGQQLIAPSGIYSYFNEKESWIEKYIHPVGKTKNWDLIVDEVDNHQIYSWPLFTDDFCSEVIQASETGRDWSRDRHKFYPTTDKLLDWIGMDKIYSEVLRGFVYPAATHLYRLTGDNWSNLKLENFVAKYESEGNQISLGIHHDTSLITALVNLSQEGEDFEGGGTYFEKQKATIQPPRGYVCIHPGNITHKHGARPTIKGTRYIIVSFSSFKG